MAEGKRGLKRNQGSETVPEKSLTPFPRRRRRWRRLLMAAALLVLLVLLAPTILSFGPAASIVRSQLRRQWPGAVALGSLRLSWFSPTRASDLVLGDEAGQPVISVRNIEVSPRPGWLSGGPLRLGTVRLRGVTGEIDLAPGGRLRRMVEALSAGRGEPSAPPRDLSCDLRVSDVRLTWIIPGAGRPIAVRVDSASARITSLSRPIEARVEGEVAQGPVLADLKLTLPPDRSLRLESLEGSLKVAVEPEALDDLQPLLDAFGVPVTVAGRAGVVANLSIADGAVDGVAQAREARFSIGLPGVTDRIVAEIPKATVSFVGLGEPLVAKVEGRLAEGPFSLQGYLTLPADGPIRRETCTAATVLKAAWPNLSDLDPLIALSGWSLKATGAGNLQANVTLENGTLSATASFEGEEVTVAGEVLRGDRVALGRPRLDLDVSHDGRTLKVGRASLQSEPVDVTTFGSIDLRPQMHAPRVEATARVEARLPQLARALPNMLRLRPGLVLEAGTADATFRLRRDGATLDADGTLDVAHLRGTLDGQRVALDAPVRAIVSGAVTVPSLGVGPGPQEPFAVDVRAARIEAAFATVEGKGSLSDLRLAATYDLARLDATARQFLDLGGLALAGKGETVLTVKEQGTRAYAFSAATSVSDLALAGLAEDAIREARASLEVDGVLTLHDGALRADLAVTEFHLDTTAGSASGSAELRGLGGDARVEAADVLVSADLERLTKQVGRLLLPPGARASGRLAVRTTGAGTLATLNIRQEIRGTDLVFQPPTASSQAPTFRCDVLALDHETTVTQSDDGWRTDVTKWDAQSSLITGTGSAVLVSASPFRIEHARMHLDDLNVDRLAEGLRAWLPTGLVAGGRISGEVSVSEPKPGRYHVKADVRTEGLSASGGPLRTPWAGGDVSVAFEGDVRRAPGPVRVDAETLTLAAQDGGLNLKTGAGTWFAGDGTGSIDATVALKAETLPALLKPFLAQPIDERDLALAGQCAGRIKGGLADGRVTVETLDVTVKDFAARGSRVGPEVVRDEAIRVTGRGTWDSKSGALDVPAAAVRSSLVTLDVADLQVALDGGALKSAAVRVTADADLDRLSRAFGWMVGLAPDALSGRLRLDHTLTTSGRQIHAAGRVPIADFAWQAGAQRFTEPKVEAEYDVTYDTATAALEVRKVAVQAGPQAVVVAGSVSAVGVGPRPVDLRVLLAYDAQALAERFEGLLPADVAVSGRRRATISIRGDAAGGTWREAITGLTADGEMALDEVGHLGATISQPTLTLRLARGRLQLGRNRWRINDGVGELMAELDLTADPVVVAVREPVVLLGGVGFDQGVASEYLKFVNPIFAEVGRVRGAVTFQLHALRLPLSADWQRQMEAQATAEFRGVQLDSSSLLRLILVALEERPTGVVGDMAPFALRARHGRIHYDTIRIPVKDFTVDLTGSVGFDETLALEVSVPLTERMLPGRGEARRYLEGARVRIAIGGTFADPKLDQHALERAIDGVIRDAMRKAAEEGARKLLERLLDRGRRE